MSTELCLEQGGGEGLDTGLAALMWHVSHAARTQRVRRAGFVCTAPYMSSVRSAVHEPRVDEPSLGVL